MYWGGQALYSTPWYLLATGMISIATDALANINQIRNLTI